MNGIYGCNNPWALTPKEINKAMNNIPMIPTPVTENLAITMSKSVAFEAQKKLFKYISDNCNPMNVNHAIYTETKWEILCKEFGVE